MSLTNKPDSIITTFKRHHNTLTFDAASLNSSHPVTFTLTDGEDDKLTSSEFPESIGRGTVQVFGTPPGGSFYAAKGYHAPRDGVILVAAYVELLRIQRVEALHKGKMDKYLGKVAQMGGKEVGKAVVNALMGAS